MGKLHSPLLTTAQNTPSARPTAQRLAFQLTGGTNKEALQSRAIIMIVTTHATLLYD